MKSVSSLLLVILFLSFIAFYSCIKKEVPSLTTSIVNNISGTEASCGGTIISEGTGTVTVRGVCWSTNITPTIADNKTQDGAGGGTFTSNISSLKVGTTYYVRAYATNSAGTGYGIVMSFKTLIPICKTCQLNTYNSNGVIITSGAQLEYCDDDLVAIESISAVTISGVTTKWVCR